MDSNNLLQVQKEALKASKGRTGFAYFMEMGLGKTLVTYMDFLEHVAEREVTRMVVVCPNSFKGGWKDEAAKWGLKVDVHVYESGNIHMNNAFLKKKYDRPPVLVINYEAIRSHTAQMYIQRFIHDRNCWITFDESIQLKNNKAAQVKAALTLAKGFKFRRVLSGKPMTQGPHDYWGSIRAIDKTNMNYYAWRTSFCRMGGYMQKQVVGAQNEDILAEIIRPHAFFATKAEWTDIPEKMYTQRGYKLTPEMDRMYRQMHNEFVLWIEENDYVSVDAAISKYIKLAQIQCGFIIREDGSIQELVDPDANPRVALLKEIIETELTGKVVIAYHHKYSLVMLSKALEKYFPANISGGMSEAEIRAEKDKFNNHANCRVMLAQIRASKYGHSLLGGTKPNDRCSTFMFFENTYSLDDRSQVEDRIHRHGQTQSCLYIDLFGTDLDRRVNAALQRKENVYQNVLRAVKERPRQTV